MKYAARMLAILVTMMPLLASAQLTSGQNLVSKVPFQFRAGNSLAPAGQWVVERAGLDARALIIRNTEAKSSQFARASMTEARETAANNSLVFHKYGERYFLAGIKLEGSKIMYEFPESRAEAELRAQNISSSDLTVLALLQ